MTKLTLLGAAAILATALATPAMSQEATQEPGMIGFNYPNSDYLRGGYGVRLQSRYDRSYYGPHVYYGPGYYRPGYYRPGYVGGPVGVAAGVIGAAGAIVAAPYPDSYAYYGDEPGYW